MEALVHELAFRVEWIQDRIQPMPQRLTYVNIDIIISKFFAALLFYRPKDYK